MSNVFGQMKDLYKMQREAKKMQEQMRKIKVTGESRKGTVRMYFNGAQELENVTVDESMLDSGSQEEMVGAIKEAYKDYQKKLQKEMSKNVDMAQLKSMLG